MELLLDPVVGNCGHDFCKMCIDGWKSSQQEYGKPVQCPICRAVLLLCPSQTIGVCHRLKATIELLFPQESATRRQMVQRFQPKSVNGLLASSSAAASPQVTTADSLFFLSALGSPEAAMFTQSHGYLLEGQPRSLQLPREELFHAMTGNTYPFLSPVGVGLIQQQTIEAVAVRMSQSRPTGLQSGFPFSEVVAGTLPSTPHVLPGDPPPAAVSTVSETPPELVQLACLTAGYLPGLYQVVLRSPLLTHLVPQFQHLLSDISDVQVLGGGISQWASRVAPQTFLEEIESLLVKALVAARTARARELLDTLKVYASGMYGMALQLASSHCAAEPQPFPVRNLQYGRALVNHPMNVRSLEDVRPSNGVLQQPDNGLQMYSTFHSIERPNHWA